MSNYIVVFLVCGGVIFQVYLHFEYVCILKCINTGGPPVGVRGRATVGDSHLRGVYTAELPAGESVPTSTGFELDLPSTRHK